MSAFIRWLKFNMVGAMGMAVQLSALAALNMWTGGHYLFATAIAIELTLVHNFIWHLHYTWRDRIYQAALLSQFIRFHLSNGLVSMLGNLILMRLLVQNVRLPLLAASSLAIIGCSIVNFLLSDRWVFALKNPSVTQPT